MALINFYGNNIPCNMTIHLYDTCSCHDITCIFVPESFVYFYDIWQKSKDEVHMGIYFNMNVNIIVFINGSNKNQLEIIHFLCDDVPRGFGDLDSQDLRDKIEHIRSSVLYYY